MNIKQLSYQKQANTLIHAFQKRNMEASYVDSKEEANRLVQTLIRDNSTVSFGGSMTLYEAGIIDELKSRDAAGKLTLLDRGKATTQEEAYNIPRDAFFSDYYLMSSNALTMDGELVNVDGNGNRLAALIFGPKKVFVVCGMNKVCKNEADARTRIQITAAPMNTLRLNKNTPCAKTGFCHQCLGTESICCQTVITRLSRDPGRIHVILVGEALGY